MSEDALKFVYTGSGKASIGLCLWDLKRRGIIKDRSTQITCPPYMGSWVYASMLPFATPSISRENHKVLWIYNEFGIPADIDAIRSKSNNNEQILVQDNAYNIGPPSSKFDCTQGYFEYKVHSFSKVTPVAMLGGLSLPQISLNEVTARQQSSKVSLATMHNLHQIYDRYFFSNNESSFSNYLREISYATYYRQYKPIRWQKIKLKTFYQKERKIIIKKLDKIREILGELGMKKEYFNSNELISYIPLVSGKDKSPLIDLFINNNIKIVERKINLSRNLLDPHYSKEILIKMNKFSMLNDIDKILRLLKERI